MARAYTVLGQPEEALKALVSASEAAPGDLKLQLAVLEQLMLAGQAGDRSQTSDQALANEVLVRALAVNAEHPELLFFAGHFARQEGDKDKARFYWVKLLDTIPQTSETARLLQAELDKLAH